MCLAPRPPHTLPTATFSFVFPLPFSLSSVQPPSIHSFCQNACWMYSSLNVTGNMLLLHAEYLPDGICNKMTTFPFH